LLAALGGAREKDGGRCAGEDEEEEDNAEFVGAAEPFQFVQDLMVVGVGVHAKRNCYECYRLGGGVDERCVSTRARNSTLSGSKTFWGQDTPGSVTRGYSDSAPSGQLEKGWSVTSGR